MLRILMGGLGLLMLAETAVARMSYRVPERVKEKYAYLEGLEVQTLPDGSWMFHNGRLWRKGGINVLHLRGDRYEMAYQHGRLLRDEIRGGSLQQASDIGENGIRNNLGDGLVGRLLNVYSDRLIADRILERALAAADGVTDENLADAYGLSAATGVPVETVIRAALGPETAQVLLGLTATDAGGPAIAADPSQCSSFVAWGEHTEDGGVLIGRNTDYPLNGFYDRHPTVIYYEPSGGAQRFMTTTSAGFHNAGVVGFNESGLYMAIHTVPTTHVGTDGLPVFLYGQEVLRSARDFDEALAALRRLRTAAGWNYLLVSARERRAATVELANDGAEVREVEADAMVTTNHWLTPAMAPRYLSINHSVDEDSLARRAVLLEGLGRGPVGVDDAIRMLGSKRDPFSGRLRSLPYTVAVSTTVSSSVWQPDRGRLYLATGAAPVSRNAYVELPTVDRFDPVVFSASGLAVRNPPREADVVADAAEQVYIQARQAYEYRNDAAGALVHLRRAAAMDAENPALHLVHGLMAVRAGRLDEATAALERTVALGWDAHRGRVAWYYLGRILADRRQDQAAREAFERVAADPEAEVRLADAARWALKALDGRRRLPLEPTHAAIMMQQADLYHYGGMLQH